jgi:Ca2+-binding EF-hand superfamily protein
LISIGFFSKFIKAKVDKKRSLEEIKELVALIDFDRDGFIGPSDLEAFLGRSNFHKFFE